MAGGELTSTNGTVIWDGVGTLRIRYDRTPTGLEPLPGSLFARLGERVLPVEALQSVEVAGDGLRLVLRDGADPLLAVTGVGVLGDLYDFPGVVAPGIAEQLAGEIRRTLTRRDVPATPSAAWLVAPPTAPYRLEGHDATLMVANGQLVFAYHGPVGRKKALGNPWSVALGDISGIEWRPEQGRLGTRGFLRIATAATPDVRPKPKHDPAAMVIRRGAGVDALFFAARLLTRIRP